MEQTIVVECSRQSSIESTTGNNSNPAEWTCDTGSGIVLDISAIGRNLVSTPNLFFFKK